MLELVVTNVGTLSQARPAETVSVSGAGLEMIDALKPSQGAEFSLTQKGSLVSAMLRLTPPVIVRV